MINPKTWIVAVCFLIMGPALFISTAYSGHADLKTGFILADDTGKILLSQNKNRQFVPASTLKLLTSLAALKTFGENFSFSTAYFFDPDSKNLYIKGYGDPLFISEEINWFCDHIISNIQTKHIRHIFLDHSFFSPQINIPGKGNSLNPYDAPVGALSANFNTITFKWSASDNRFISAEPQTPLLPDFHDQIKKTHLTQGRIILSDQQSKLYAGLLIRYFLKKKGIQITGDVLEGTLEKEVEIDKKDIKEHIYLSSFKMTDIIQKLLQYSNNFIANQVMLNMGAHRYGSPANLEKGVRALQSFAEHDLKLSHVIVHEGSGLSRSNKISPEQMLTLLYEFMPYYALLNHTGNDYFKTGTLTDVRSRAGYISGENKRLYPYVILVNEKNKGYDILYQKLIRTVFDMTKRID